MPVLMPEELDEALALKTAQPEAVPMAGGTDLLVHWPVHLERHDLTYLDLSGLGGLRGLRWTDEALELGALATYWEVLGDARVGRELPMMHEAARQVGAIQIQSRGTWAGNIANASPAADGVPVLMAYDATVVLASTRGRREIPLEDFYRGYKQMDLRPDELIVAVRVPRVDRSLHLFHKVGPRRAQAIAKVGVAITRTGAGWRVVASSVAPTVRRCPHVERRLAAGPLAGPDDLLDAIDADVSPIDDLRSTAAYRRRVLSRIIHFGLAR